MEYHFRLATDAYFGHGIAGELLADKLRERELSRVGLVIDENVFAARPVQRLMSSLGGAGLELAWLLKGRGTEEPGYDYLDKCAKECRGTRAQCLIGIGGGSTMDLCKGIAVLQTNPGKGVEYRGMDKVTRPGLPTVLIPTTAGSGSEATFTAVFIDKQAKIKMGINGKNVRAQMAFLDSDFLESCPRSVAIASGMDAMVHALEAFMTTRKNPIIWEFAIQSWRLLMTNFRASLEDAANRTAKLNMLLGSYLAGITLMFSGGGIAGALSYPLGVDHKVPHGLAGGVLLEHIIETNLAHGYEGYGLLYDRTYERPADSVADKSRSFLARFRELLSSINAPKDLRAFRIPKEDIQRLAALTVEQRSAVLRQNPVACDETLLAAILDRVI